MPLPPPQTKEFVDRLAALAAECRGELESTSQSLQEIALLVNQTSAEVDRLSQRELQIANRVREMETNLESYARADIRDLYHAAHDVELRLMMMRNQMEQLQEREQSIRTYQEKLRVIVEIADSHLQAAQEREQAAGTRLLRRGQNGSASVVPLGDIIEAREDERGLLAQRVLEGPAQTLANVILETEICERLLERAPERAQGELAELRRIATRALLDTRRMLYELKPVVLKELGVVPALRRYLAEIARDREIQANVVGPEADPVPEVIQAALYRLLQELVAAAAADDGVARIDVDVRYEPAQVIGRVEVTGDAVAKRQALARYLASEAARRRTELLGADLQREAVSESTTRLTLVVPLE